MGIEYAYNNGASHFLLLNQNASMNQGAVKKLVDVQSENSLPLVSPIHWDGPGRKFDSVSACLSRRHPASMNC
jgi:GT2 family glycosyltransferase